MINYYYEIQDDVTTFGRGHKYLANFDVKPGINVSATGWRKFHDENAELKGVCHSCNCSKGSGGYRHKKKATPKKEDLAEADT